jgi:hypothetical protein
MKLKTFRALSLKSSVLSVSLLSMILASSPSFALVDAELQIGQRNASWKNSGDSSSLTSQVIRVAGHLDPIPLVPIGFGLGLYSESWKVDKDKQGLSSMSSYSLVPEITAWLPLGDLKPMARIGYSILTAYSAKPSFVIGTQTVNTGTLLLAGAGLRAAVGLDWAVPVVPLLSVTGALEYSSETVKLAKDKIGDIDVSPLFKSVTISSTAILVGARLSL